jgi:hypothetical protein
VVARHCSCGLCRAGCPCRAEQTQIAGHNWRLAFPEGYGALSTHLRNFKLVEKHTAFSTTMREACGVEKGLYTAEHKIYRADSSHTFPADGSLYVDVESELSHLFPASLHINLVLRKLPRHAQDLHHCSKPLFKKHADDQLDRLQWVRCETLRRQQEYSNYG